MKIIEEIKIFNRKEEIEEELTREVEQEVQGIKYNMRKHTVWIKN